MMKPLTPNSKSLILGIIFVACMIAFGCWLDTVKIERLEKPVKFESWEGKE